MKMTMMRKIVAALAASSLFSGSAFAFSSNGQPVASFRTTPSSFSTGGQSRETALFMAKKDEKYQNKVAELLSNFMSNQDDVKRMSGKAEDDPLGDINFEAPKKKLPLSKLAQVLDDELLDKEWFVTGRVNPIYFSKDFQFKDPDVSIDGIEGT